MSYFIAQFISVIMFVAGFSMLVNPKSYLKILVDYTKNPALLNLSGFMSLIIGYLILTYHNVWTLNWQLLITLVGCLSFVKGVMLVAFPNVVLSIVNIKKWSESNIKGHAVIVIILSIVFGYFGFGA